MLVLQVKRNDILYIEVDGKTVAGIMITDHKGNRYRTAISAPKNVRIIREDAKNKKPIMEESKNELQ